MNTYSAPLVQYRLRQKSPSQILGEAVCCCFIGFLYRYFCAVLKTKLYCSVCIYDCAIKENYPKSIIPFGYQVFGFNHLLNISPNFVGSSEFILFFGNQLFPLFCLFLIFLGEFGIFVYVFILR